MNGSISFLSSPSKNIDKLVRDNIKKNKQKEIEKEIEKLQVQGDLLLKKEAIHQMNENVRKLNSVKMSKKKKPFKKNLTIKLSMSNMKSEKPKGVLTTKGSFVQEFKKIRKEIEEELKKEDMKYKSRVSTACVSPKNVTHSMIGKPSQEQFQFENEIHHMGRKKSIRKFMKQKKKKFKKEKILQKSQEFKKHFKVKQNLKVLNKYVKHIRARSSGVYYNRSSGNYEHRKKFNNKMYKGFEKARTPKYNDF